MLIPGTEQSYAYLDFSPDGLLLASVGGDPDYMMTIWDWKNEDICLRCKAFSQDIFRVTFSSEIHGEKVQRDGVFFSFLFTWCENIGQ